MQHSKLLAAPWLLQQRALSIDTLKNAAHVSIETAAIVGAAKHGKNVAEAHLCPKAQQQLPLAAQVLRLNFQNPTGGIAGNNADFQAVAIGCGLQKQVAVRLGYLSVEIGDNEGMGEVVDVLVYCICVAIALQTTDCA